MTSNDGKAVISLRTNPRVFYWKTPDTPEEAMQWLKDRLEDPLSLVYAVEIVFPDSNSKPEEPIVIGFTGAHHLPEVGYIFEPDFWGKGYATEALKAWLAMYWQQYPDGHPSLERTLGASQGLPFLKAETGPEGKASAKVLQKCGFVFEKQRDVHEGEGEKETVVLNCWRAERPVMG